MINGPIAGGASALSNKVYDQAQTTATKRVEESGISEELGRLAQAISQHEAMLSELAQRIAPVIRNEPQPTGVGQANAPDVSRSAIGEQIRSNRRLVEELTAQIRILMRMIEL